MKQVKEKLELLRDIEESERLNFISNDKLHLWLGGRFCGRNILFPMVELYKKTLLGSLIPSQDIGNSIYFQNVIESYNRWFQNIEFNEYFIDAWGKIFAYLYKDKEQMSEEASWWSLEQIYYEASQIAKKSEKEKLSFLEDEFLGNFRTCFPSLEDASVVHLATNFFHHFTIFYYSIVSDSVSLTALEKIYLASIWKKFDERKEQRLMKERVK